MDVTMKRGWFFVALLVSGLGGGVATEFAAPSRAEIENAVRQAYESSIRECELHAFRGGAEYANTKGKGY